MIYKNRLSLAKEYGVASELCASGVDSHITLGRAKKPCVEALPTHNEPIIIAARASKPNVCRQ